MSDAVSMPGPFQAACRALTRHFLAILVLSVLVAGGAAVALGLAVRQGQLSPWVYMVWMLGPWFVLTAVLAPFAEEAVTGEKRSVLQMLRPVLRALPSVLLITLLAMLSTTLGGLVFVIPGVIVFCSYWPALGLAVLEPRPSAAQTLQRSADLAQGHKWQIFRLWFLLCLLWLLLATPLGLFAGLECTAANWFGPTAQWLLLGAFVLLQAVFALVGGAIASILRRAAQQKMSPDAAT